jgi:hypothetical protein
MVVRVPVEALAKQLAESRVGRAKDTRHLSGVEVEQEVAGHYLRVADGSCSGAYDFPALHMHIVRGKDICSDAKELIGVDERFDKKLKPSVDPPRQTLRVKDPLHKKLILVDVNRSSSRFPPDDRYPVLPAMLHIHLPFGILMKAYAYIGTPGTGEHHSIR